MQAQSTAPTSAVSAGFGERLVAHIIDLVILVIPQLIVQVLTNQGIATVFGLVLGVGYFVYFWTQEGATPGKMAMGLRVVSAETGELIDPGTALLRYVGYIISSLALLLGYLWIIWDPQHDGWHDKIAKTHVIKIR